MTKEWLKFIPLFLFILLIKAIFVSDFNCESATTYHYCQWWFHVAGYPLYKLHHKKAITLLSRVNPSLPCHFIVHANSPGT